MTDLLSSAITLAYAGLLISFFFALVRLVRGPTNADRVVALDLIGFITISLITTHTISSGETSFLDIAITLALVAFLGTVAFVSFMGARLARPRTPKEKPPWKS